MDSLKFNKETGRVRQGKVEFHPGVLYGFEDPDAAEYFETLGWAERVKGDPEVVITIDELDIDPETVWGYGPDKGNPVMPERAAAAKAAREAAGEAEDAGDMNNG